MERRFPRRGGAVRLDACVPPRGAKRPCVGLQACSAESASPQPHPRRSGRGARPVGRWGRLIGDVTGVRSWKRREMQAPGEQHVCASLFSPCPRGRAVHGPSSPAHGASLPCEVTPVGTACAPSRSSRSCRSQRPLLLRPPAGISAAALFWRWSWPHSPPGCFFRAALLGCSSSSVCLPSGPCGPR